MRVDRCIFARRVLTVVHETGADGDFVHQGTAESATLREIIHNEFLYPKDKYVFCD